MDKFTKITVGFVVQSFAKDDIENVWKWLEEHDERLSVEIVEQHVNGGINQS